MATTTPKAFDQFKDKLILTSAQSQIVSSRRVTVNGYLLSSFGNATSLPLERTILIGSAGRSTIIRPLDDIDVMAVFTNKANIFETYRYDSQAFLYRVRNALSQYQVQVVGARGQAVRLFYNNAPNVDIAPVFRWSSGGYALPDGTGGWLTTDPEEHAAYMARRNIELSSALKSLVRMLKRWNSVHSGRLKSFHLEVLVSKSFVSLNGDSRDACEKFFGYAKDHISVDDPAGYGGDLSSYLSWSQRADVRTSLQNAQDRAVKANAAERRGDHAEAIRLWRLIFGDEFPAFG